MHFHSNLKTIRNYCQYTQQQMADILGYTRSKYNSYEQGVEPKLGQVLAISRRLGIPLDLLIKIDLSALSQLKLRELTFKFLNR